MVREADPICAAIYVRKQKLADYYYSIGRVGDDGCVCLTKEDLQELEEEYANWIEERLDLMLESIGYFDEIDDFIALCLYKDQTAPPRAVCRPESSTRRGRARRSHRVVRAVVKTAGGDSGDGDPEPELPTTRRTPTIGGTP